DYKVTGVQTCALPILSLTGLAPSDQGSPSDFRLGLHAFPEASCGHLCLSTGLVWLTVSRLSHSGNCGRLCQEDFCNNSPPLCVQIGRASCRERVDMAE